MRTTLTLDKDVAAQLEQLRKQRGVAFRTLVNDALRQGLLALTIKPKPSGKFKTNSVSLGRCLIGNVDNVAEVLALAEGEDFK